MYRYELHMHTQEGSACGHSLGAEMVEYYQSLGYSGMAVTDHFYHGNTAPSRELSWQKYMEAFAEGYYQCKKAAENADFDVFFGIEERLIDFSEYIILGLEPEWYIRHPELRDMGGTDFLETVRAHGAFVIHAHPFRERPYMKNRTIYLTPTLVDAIEVKNCGNPAEIDRRSYEYAKQLDKPMTGGSDNHQASFPKDLSGIEVPDRCRTVDQLIDAIRSNRQTVIGLQDVLSAPLTHPEFSVITL